jgi:hypothetical protein
VSSIFNYKYCNYIIYIVTYCYLITYYHTPGLGNDDHHDHHPLCQLNSLCQTEKGLLIVAMKWDKLAHGFSAEGRRPNDGMTPNV